MLWIEIVKAWSRELNFSESQLPALPKTGSLSWQIWILLVAGTQLYRASIWSLSLVQQREEEVARDIQAVQLQKDQDQREAHQGMLL